METPEFFQTDAGFYNPHFTQDKRPTDDAPKNGDHFIIDDLLDFPNDDDASIVEEDGGFEAGILTANSTDSSAVDTSCNSSFSAGSVAEPYFNAADLGGHQGFVDGQFSSQLCVPYDDLAELEWLSNFGEESFSSEDLQKLQLIQGMKARTNNESNSEIHQYHFQPETISRNGPMLKVEMSVPAKARSKRSRAAPGNWTSRLLGVSPIQWASTISAVSLSSSSESDNITTTSGAGKKVVKAAEAALLKKEGLDNSSNSGEERKCLHCATDKTPQWRTGPMGPKTLCNACGVRYKSGRLVPEYRPAASPTFVLTKHSNSHRKVVELRRQKESMIAQQHQQFLNHQSNMMFDASNGDDYLIHQHIGPDFRQLI